MKNDEEIQSQNILRMFDVLKIIVTYTLLVGKF